MSTTSALFDVLRQSTDPAAVAAVETLVREGTDRSLNRINALTFADNHALKPDTAIDAFVRAARLGLFEMSWNVLCPGCGGVLNTGASLHTVRNTEYHCALCSAGYEPTLDEMVEVTFTVSPIVRRIAAHAPELLPIWEYVRQMFWGTGLAIPEEGFDALIDRIIIDFVELAPGGKAILSVQLPAEVVIVFDPVVHSAQFIDVKGEPTTERQHLSLIYNAVQPPQGTMTLRPGPLRVSLENRTDTRVLPALWIAADPLHDLLGSRRPFLTAKRLLSNQTFRDLYSTDALLVDQQLRITSLTFLFTDLRGSTALYERVGDLAAFDLVRKHFGLLLGIVSAEGGAVVKTIGDAVMATFNQPEQAIAAALRMRDAMRDLTHDSDPDGLRLKIGIHAGPCLAVMLNERQDYFGQTVNVASRVQQMAVSDVILATAAVVEDSASGALLAQSGRRPTARREALRGVAEALAVYEIA